MYCTLLNPVARATCLMVMSGLSSNSLTLARRTRLDFLVNGAADDAL